MKLAFVCSFLVIHIVSEVSSTGHDKINIGWLKPGGKPIVKPIRGGKPSGDPWPSAPAKKPNNPTSTGHKKPSGDPWPSAPVKKPNIPTGSGHKKPSVNPWPNPTKGLLPRPIPGSYAIDRLDFNKFFPTIPKKPFVIKQVLKDNKWKEWLLANPIPVKRPIYPPVYEPPTDIPPNPFGEVDKEEPETPYYTEKPVEPVDDVYTEPTRKPIYTPSHITKGPQYTEATTQDGYAVGPTGNPSTTDLAPNIYEIAQLLGLNRFLHLIDEAGLDNLLLGNGPITVFIPSNEAYEKLPYEFLQELSTNKESLKKFLLYHIISGQAQQVVTDGNNNQQFTADSGHKLNIASHHKTITVNGALVFQPNLKASNGIFHILYDCIYPYISNNIHEVIQADSKYSILLDLLGTAGLLDDHLKNGGPFTFFAPTNSAFEKLDASTLKWLKDNPLVLREILLSYFVKGIYSSVHLKDGDNLKAVFQDNTLTVANKNQVIYINNKLVSTGIYATNGLVYSVNELLFDVKVSGLLETLQSQGDLVSFFLEVLEKAGLIDDHLKTGGPFTLFVPTTEAFKSIDALTLNWYLANPLKLKELLLNYFVNGVYRTKDLKAGTVLTSISGTELKITSTYDYIAVNDNKIVKGDLIASNGVVHLVEGILFDVKVNNFLDNLKSENKYTKFLQLIEKAGLVDEYIVGVGPYTLFAPSDEALNKLDPKVFYWLLSLPVADLKTLLLKHFTSGVHYLKDLGSHLYSIEHSPLKFTKDSVTGQTLVNGVLISHGNIDAVNGVIHVVDGFLFDVTFKNLHETLKTGNKFTVFLQLLDKAGLIDEHLQNGGPYTVFAPSDLVLNKVDQKIISWLLNLPKEKLRGFILQHFVSGNYYLKDLSNGQQLSTIQNTQLTIQKTSYSDVSVNNQKIILPTLFAENGLIHVVDGIFFKVEFGNLLDSLNENKCTIFIQLLEKAGLIDDHLKNGGPYTIFAPSNDAINNLDKKILTWLWKLSKEELKAVILQHIATGVYYVNSLTDNLQLYSVQKTTLNFKKDGEHTLVNNVKITHPDNYASNGVVHIINGVLFEATFKNLLETLQSHGNAYKTFLEALKNSGLIDQHLTDGGPFTVFVPTEEAFKKIDPVTLKWLLWDPTTLKALVLKHFVKGVNYYDELENGTTLSALGNQAQLVIANNAQGHKTVNGIPISAYDILASNGVIHVVDSVLFAESIKKTE